MRRAVTVFWFTVILLLVAATWLLSEVLRDVGRAPQAPPVRERSLELPWGGELTIPLKPLRVLPANAGAADLATILLPPERIVALPEQAFTWSRLAERPDGYTHHPRIKRFVAEEILDHGPDLVLADSINTEETRKLLEAAGIPVLTLPDISRVDATLEVLELLGEAFGTQKRARELIDSLRARMAKLAAGAGARSSLRVITYANYGSSGQVGGEGTTSAEILRLAGVRNAALDAGKKGNAPLSFEELLGLDPDLIVVDTPGGGRSSPSRRVLEQTAALATLKARKNDGLIAIPTRLLSTTSHELVRAAEVLAAKIDAWMARPK